MENTTALLEPTTDQKMSSEQLYALVQSAPEFDTVDDAVAYLQEHLYTDGLGVMVDDPKVLLPNRISVRAVLRIQAQTYVAYSGLGVGATVEDASTNAIRAALGYMGIRVTKPVSYTSETPSMGQMLPPTLPSSGDMPRTINGKSGDPEIGRMLNGLQDIYRGKIKQCACGDMLIKGIRTKAGDASALWSCPQNNKDHESWIDKDVKLRALGFNG